MAPQRGKRASRGSGEDAGVNGDDVIGDVEGGDGDASVDLEENDLLKKLKVYIRDEMARQSESLVEEFKLLHDHQKNDRFRGVTEDRKEKQKIARILAEVEGLRDQVSSMRKDLKTFMRQSGGRGGKQAQPQKKHKKYEKNRKTEKRKKDVISSDPSDTSESEGAEMFDSDATEVAQDESSEDEESDASDGYKPRPSKSRKTSVAKGSKSKSQVKSRPVQSPRKGYYYESVSEDSENETEAPQKNNNSVKKRGRPRGRPKRKIPSDEESREEEEEESDGEMEGEGNGRMKKFTPKSSTKMPGKRGRPKRKMSSDEESREEESDGEMEGGGGNGGMKKFTTKMPKKRGRKKAPKETGDSDSDALKMRIRISRITEAEIERHVGSDRGSEAEMEADVPPKTTAAQSNGEKGDSIAAQSDEESFSTDLVAPSSGENDLPATTTPAGGEIPGDTVALSDGENTAAAAVSGKENSTPVRKRGRPPKKKGNK